MNRFEYVKVDDVAVCTGRSKFVCEGGWSRCTVKSKLNKLEHLWGGLEHCAGWERLIRSHSSARFGFELSGTSN